MTDIPETGIIYDLPFADYLACKSHYSSSEIRLMLESPRLLWEKRNAKEPEDPNQEHFIMGRCLHAALLEHKQDWHVAPSAYPSKDDKTGEVKYKPWHNGATWCKDWYAKHADRDILTTAQHEEVMEWVAAAKADEEAQSYLNVEGKSEVSMFAVDEETQVPLRIRIDWMPVFGRANLDVKTALDATPRGFTKAMTKRQYFVQSAQYTYVYNLVAAQNGLPPKDEWIYVAIGKPGSHLVKCYRQAPMDMELGRQLIKKALRRIRFCLDNPWAWQLAYPGEKQGQIQTLQLPKYTYENTDLTPDTWMNPEWRQES